MDKLLDEVKATLIERGKLYGEPTEHFADTAALWSTITGLQFDPVDVALMMLMLKLSRIKQSPDHKDNWADLIGYAAIGWYLTRTDEILTKAAGNEREQAS